MEASVPPRCISNALRISNTLRAARNRTVPMSHIWRVGEQISIRCGIQGCPLTPAAMFRIQVCAVSLQNLADHRDNHHRQRRDYRIGHSTIKNRFVAARTRPSIQNYNTSHLARCACPPSGSPQSYFWAAAECAPNLFRPCIRRQRL
jgi:hypothetical protein